MSSNDEFLKKRQEEIKDKKSKLTKDDKVELSLNVVNQMLDVEERLIRSITALNVEVKKLQKQGGQTTLE